MENSNCKSFYYDTIISLNSDLKLQNVLNSFSEVGEFEKYLSVTFDHRFYSIHQKNIIKSRIDGYDLDNLLFTIRPSIVEIVKKLKNYDYQKFKSLSQLCFVVDCLIKYDIKKAVISSDYLITDSNFTLNSKTISESIENFICELKNAVSQYDPEIQFCKTFCFYFSILNRLNKIENKKFEFYESFCENDKLATSAPNKIIPSISEIEKNIFWLGFDPDFKEVPWEKQYSETKWTSLFKQSEYGAPLFNSKIRYCNRCCMPETMEGIVFDEFGICTPCRSSEEKMHINWEEREIILREIINANRQEQYYDCLLPMSGGKDSMFQAHVLVSNHKLTPLAVTHGMSWMSLTGRYNLENCLQKFDMDHLFFCSKRSTINKVARKSLTAIGDACWHCHIGNGSFVIQTAVAWDLNLMIWGESIAERDGRGSYINQTEASVYYNLEVSGKVKAEDFVSHDLDSNELSKWVYPDRVILNNSKLRYLHLGDYMFWDEERQVDFVIDHYEWMNSKVENTFKGYKSNECVMAGVHDYANFIKRGIGRATSQAADDIRRGIITREEGIELAKRFDTERPHALDYYLKLTGYTEEDFEKILIDARNLSIYAKKLD
jgi:N-acetyl sugar amidotransferase